MLKGPKERFQLHFNPWQFADRDDEEAGMDNVLAAMPVQAAQELADQLPVIAVEDARQRTPPYYPGIGGDYSNKRCTFEMLVDFLAAIEVRGPSLPIRNLENLWSNLLQFKKPLKLRAVQAVERIYGNPHMAAAADAETLQELVGLFGLVPEAAEAILVRIVDRLITANPALQDDELSAATPRIGMLCPANLLTFIRILTKCAAKSAIWRVLTPNDNWFLELDEAGQVAWVGLHASIFEHAEKLWCEKRVAAADMKRLFFCYNDFHPAAQRAVRKLARELATHTGDPENYFCRQAQEWLGAQQIRRFRRRYTSTAVGMGL